MGIASRNFWVDSSLHSGIFLWTTTALAASLPFLLTPPTFVLPFRILCIVLALNWIIYNIRFGFRVRQKHMLLLLAVFYLLHVFGLLFTSNLSYGFSQLEKKSVLLFFPIVFCSMPEMDKRFTRAVLVGFVTSVVVASGVCLANAFLRPDLLTHAGTVNWFYFSYFDLTEVINAQPAYFAIYVGFAVLIVLEWTITSPRHFLSIQIGLLLILLSYLLIFLFLLSARMPLATTFMVVCLRVLFLFHTKRKLVLGLVVVGGIFVATAGVVYQLPILRERFLQALGVQQQTEWINQFGPATGVIPESRFIKWQAALRAVDSHWLFGVGTGDAQDALLREFEKVNFKAGIEGKYNAHCQYLQNLLDLGLLGLSALMCILFASARGAIKRKNFLHLSFMVLIATCAITESIFERQFGLAFFALFVSVFEFQGPRTHDKS